VTTRRQAIEAAHRNGADGSATALALTALMDDLLCDAFAHTPADADVRSHVALIALGGYGRRELSPHSDVDIMVLCRGGEARAGAERFAAALLRILWDAGLTIGHSVRTLDDVRDIHGHSVESWTALLEGRRVCGEEGLEQELWECLAAQSRNGPDPWMTSGILASAAARHDRFGHSVKLLEPNIKKSAGGLRDLHTVLWLVRSTMPVPGALARETPACQTLLDDLRANGTLDQTGYEACSNAFAFLLRTRHGMHYARGSAHDTLEYALQRDLAEQLGYGPRKELHSVEVFMREYHLHARTIHRFVERMLAPARSGGHAGGSAPAPRRCDDTYAILGDRLVLDPPLNNLPDAATILDAFLHVANEGAIPDGACGAALTRSVHCFAGEEQASPVLAEKFRTIIRERHPAAALRAMNDLGVLGAFIPEFGELVAFYQHSVYHYYTADEHTIIALEHAAQPEGGGTTIAEAFRRLPRPEVLYMAVLLHDIGKARGVADHEHSGAAMAEVILSRLSWSDIAADVAFLVRHHLLMEQTAFRRNIHDPGTIREFAARCGTQERLDLLTVLTYADLSAVNARVWTGWKASLLGELHTLTAAALRGAVGTESSEEERHGARVQDLVERLADRLPHEEVRSHLEGIPGRAYVASFTGEEIARHISAAGGAEAATLLFADQEGYTDVTVVARDAPFLLARCCAVLAAHDANIFDATIFTRDDGVVIDRFRVFDAATHGPLPAGVHGGMTADLRAMLAGLLDADHLFAAHRRRWRRRRKPAHGQRIRTDVVFEETAGHTIIDVYAPDALGLLYRITTAISRLDLDIVFAKIATRADGVADAFYVRKRGGGRLDDPAGRAAVREALLETITATTEEELA
jgi:[protein-PII] uridylyltransferase